MLDKAPTGYNEIVQVFGDIRKYIEDDGHLSPDWEKEYMARAVLPFSIPLAGGAGKLVTKVYCHKLLVDNVLDVFHALKDQNLQQYMHSYAGCFNFRQKRSSMKLSTHSWGIALDLNSESNEMGTPGDMKQEVVDVFRVKGWKWGGDWPGKGCDPMHFQYAFGY